MRRLTYVILMVVDSIYHTESTINIVLSCELYHARWYCITIIKHTLFNRYGGPQPVRLSSSHNTPLNRRMASYVLLSPNHYLHVRFTVHSPAHVNEYVYRLSNIILVLGWYMKAYRTGLLTKQFPRPMVSTISRQKYVFCWRNLNHY